jgi:hypothetical protein
MAKVRARRAKGWSWPEIAADFDAPLSTVYERHNRLELRELKLADADRSEQVA